VGTVVGGIVDVYQSYRESLLHAGVGVGVRETGMVATGVGGRRSGVGSGVGVGKS